MGSDTNTKQVLTLWFSPGLCCQNVKIVLYLYTYINILWQTITWGEKMKYLNVISRSDQD